MAFFDMVISAHINYPTYDFLAKAGFTPSNSTRYSLTALEGALTNATGARPYVSSAFLFSGPQMLTPMESSAVPDLATTRQPQATAPAIAAGLSSPRSGTTIMPLARLQL